MGDVFAAKVSAEGTTDPEKEVSHTPNHRMKPSVLRRKTRTNRTTLFLDLLGRPADRHTATVRSSSSQRHAKEVGGTLPTTQQRVLAESISQRTQRSPAASLGFAVICITAYS